MSLLSHVSTADASKSRVEIAAANNLRKLYNALLADSGDVTAEDDGQQRQQQAVLSPQRNTAPIARPQSARLASKPRSLGTDISSNSRTSALDAVRLIRRQRHHQISQPVLLLPAKSPFKFNYVRKPTQTQDLSGATVFAKWVDLATTISSLEANATDLKRELKASELRFAELQHHAYLTTDSSELDPKLQCLEEILGQQDFQRYLHDLNAETAGFRVQFTLYGRPFQWFQQKVWETHDKRVTKAMCLDILNRAVAKSTTSSTSGPQPTKLVVLLSQYPMLFQHCLDTGDAERIVLTELLALLSALPAGRERLLRHLFEQIADARRGEGPSPPPDLVRPHKLTALTKQSLSSGLCSRQEFDEVDTWVTEAMAGGQSSAGISLSDFLLFHVKKSDTYCAEDAEFVTYLMRIWGFQTQNKAESLDQVLKSYETRCQLRIAAARKRELVLKIQTALSSHVTKFTSLEAQVQQLQVLQLNSAPVWKAIQNDVRLATQCGTSLALLKVLTLSSQCLQAFPAFLTTLSQLEVLDLSENLIAALPVEIEQLQGLQRLALSSNRLTDTSFQGLEIPFSKLSALLDLRLDSNHLTTLPRAIPAISGLTALDLSQNQLRKLPRTVVRQWSESGKCQLVSLDLHHNVLTSLPEELAGLSPTLQHLILHENKLEGLPQCIALMLKLDTLTLSHNAMGCSASGFHTYPSTLEQRHVRIDHNQLRQFPAMTYGEKLYLEGLPPQVQSIDASWNRLKTFPPGALGSLLPHCEELNLSHNNLAGLPDDLFLALPGLRVCILSSNQLQRLPDSILSCKRLHVLDLQQNRLQTLPVDLVQQLASLVVLNAMENQLSDVPSEWHAFNSYYDPVTGYRLLQTLALKKNPIRNKVLKTLIDGGSVDASLAMRANTKPNDEQLCEFAVKKVIHALHSTLEVLAMETGSADVDGYDEDRSSGTQVVKARWKGMTRNVVKYLEQRLHMIHTAEMQHKASSSSSIDHRLLVSERAFRRLLKSLPSTCSDKELTSLVSQFKAGGPPTSDDRTMVSGYHFLLAIDRFGQHGTLSSAPAVANSSFAISKPGDPVASVLHYLSIVHSQYQQRTERLASPVKKKQSLKVDYVKKNKLRVELHQSPTALGELKMASASPTRRHKQQQIEEREAEAKSRFLQRHLSPESEVVLRRQKQRIQILEQQLMDQKLLLLSQQTAQAQAQAQGSRHPELGPAADEDSSDEEPKAPADSSVLVSVKCVKGQEHLPAMQRWKIGPLAFSMSLSASVGAVKQQIERETQISTASQVLISAAPRGARCGAHVRVRNDALVKDYVEVLTAESKLKWHVTLLVGESLRLGSQAQ